MLLIASKACRDNLEGSEELEMDMDYEDIPICRSC